MAAAAVVRIRPRQCRWRHCLQNPIAATRLCAGRLSVTVVAVVCAFVHVSACGAVACDTCIALTIETTSRVCTQRISVAVVAVVCAFVHVSARGGAVACVTCVALTVVAGRLSVTVVAVGRAFVHVSARGAAACKTCLASL